MLKIILEFRKGVLFVRLDGSLTKETIPRLQREVVSKIQEGGIRNVVLNLKKLENIDFKGMNAFLYIYELCRDNHGKLLICGLEENRVYEKLQKNNLLKYLVQINNEINAFEMVGM